MSHVFLGSCWGTKTNAWATDGYYLPALRLSSLLHSSYHSTTLRQDALWPILFSGLMPFFQLFRDCFSLNPYFQISRGERENKTLTPFHQFYKVIIGQRAKPNWNKYLLKALCKFYFIFSLLLFSAASKLLHHVWAIKFSLSTYISKCFIPL